MYRKKEFKLTRKAICNFCGKTYANTKMKYEHIHRMHEAEIEAKRY